MTESRAEREARYALELEQSRLKYGARAKAERTPRIVCGDHFYQDGKKYAVVSDVVRRDHRITSEVAGVFAVANRRGRRW